ncbi:DNA translocase FtsK 4TM domain-containing protein [Tissierella carlieri]
MNKSRKKTTKKTTKKMEDKNKYNKDIMGVIIVAIGILSMISLFSFKMGIIGSIIRGTTFSFMGFGSYLFPLIIVGSGMVFILDKFNHQEGKIILSMGFILLSILIILDGINPFDYTFYDRISNSIALSKIGKGGGIIGSFLDSSSTNYLVP